VGNGPIGRGRREERHDRSRVALENKDRIISQVWRDVVDAEEVKELCLGSVRWAGRIGVHLNVNG
jgi:hypothetical protein